MAIQLDQPRNTVPVIGPRDFGQRALGMVVNKEQRTRLNREGETILNSRGKPAQEEVLTVLVLDGNTGTISGGDLNDDYAPEVGTLGRMIVKGLTFGKLIDARKTAGGTTQVGDVIALSAPSATIWRGAGDIASANVTDPAVVAKARAKGLSVGWDIEVEYRRATPGEAALVARCEELHMELRAGIKLDAGHDDEPAF